MKKCASLLSTGQAEAIALQALAFLAHEPARLSRFISLTGIGAADLKATAERCDTLAAVLDHVLHDESLLLEFTSNHAISPEIIAPAHAVLAGAAGQEGL